MASGLYRSWTKIKLDPVAHHRSMLKCSKLMEGVYRKVILPVRQNFKPSFPGRGGSIMDHVLRKSKVRGEKRYLSAFFWFHNEVTYICTCTSRSPLSKKKKNRIYSERLKETTHKIECFSPPRPTNRAADLLATHSYSCRNFIEMLGSSRNT